MTTAATDERTPLVMQIIVDGATAQTLGWSKGIWMAQAAHASVAALQISRHSTDTQEYVSEANLPSMHKVVLQTSATSKSRLDLRELSTKLKEQQEAEPDFPLHWLWIEQPEDTPTCLAIAPNRKPAALKKILRSCTLFKD